MPAARVRSLVLLFSAGCFVDHPPTGITAGTSTGEATSAATGTGQGTSADPIEDCQAGMSPQTWYIDQDDDGWGAGAPIMACTAPVKGVGQAGDCDDADGDVNPGATEACNQRDDDCDKLIDEVSSANPECGSCTLRQHNDAAWWLCAVDGRTWLGARTDCQAFGAELASVRDPDEDTWLSAQLVAAGIPVMPDATAWIGLRRNESVAATCDVNKELWIWTDGAPFSFVSWGAGQPDNHPTTDGCPICTPKGFADPDCPRENCVDYLGDVGWNDAPCNVAGDAYICRAPHI